MSNNRHPENNGRDMTLAYLLVTSTYIIIGGAFYVCFPLPKFCIEDVSQYIIKSQDYIFRVNTITSLKSTESQLNHKGYSE